MVFPHTGSGGWLGCGGGGGCLRKRFGFGPAHEQAVVGVELVARNLRQAVVGSEERRVGGE